MKLPENYHNLIIDEFNETKELIDEAKTLEDRLYFFSSSFGIINRVMNFHYDPLLVVMHQALSNAHTNLTKRLGSPQRPGVTSSSTPPEMIEALFSYFDLLIEAVKNNDDNQMIDILQKFTVLTYATSGNGFYLYLKGKLVL